MKRVQYRLNKIAIYNALININLRSLNVTTYITPSKFINWKKIIAQLIKCDGNESLKNKFKSEHHCHYNLLMSICIDKVLFI